MSIFGTDGIRDIANQGLLSPESVLRLGRVIGTLLKKEPLIFQTNQFNTSSKRKISQRPLVIIGRDTRISGQLIENVLSAGFTSSGVDVILVGIVPTPAVAYLVRHHKANIGIVISASHNPYEHNGIKIFSQEGIKIPDKAEQLIEKHFLFPQAQLNSSLGCILTVSDAVQNYINHLCKRNSCYLKGVKIVVDCANGATTYVAPTVLRKLGAKVVEIHNKPNGININKRCGALYPTILSRAVLAKQAHLGLTFDGDGDRVIMVDEKGFIRDGDYILAILAHYLARNHQLPHRTVVSTVMANTGLEVFLREQGIKLIRTKVGDRYVAEEMFRNGYILGGEQSGHIIYLKRSPTGDGIITALEVLKIMYQENKSLWTLCQYMKKYPQVLVNLKLPPQLASSPDKLPPLEKIEGYQEMLQQAQMRLGGEALSRIIIRYSGTEPVLRIMVEAADKRKITPVINDLTNFFRRKLFVRN